MESKQVPPDFNIIRCLKSNNSIGMYAKAAKDNEDFFLENLMETKFEIQF